jgi:3-methyladenine DNA glycosylase Mpg
MLTLALDVDKSLNGVDVTNESSPVYVQDIKFECEICTSYRIGVTQDLPEHYRYYVKNNKYVSK